MILCRWCKKTIINTGNPKILYSNCSDCNYNISINKNKKKEED